MINKEDLKQEIEQLDENYLDLIFRLLQQFPHRQIEKSRIDLLAYSRPIHYSDIVNDDKLAYTNVEDAAFYGKQLRSSVWQRNNIKHD